MYRIGTRLITLIPIFWMGLNAFAGGVLVTEEYFPTEAGTSTPYGSGGLSATIATSSAGATTRFSVTSPTPGFESERWYYSNNASGLFLHRIESDPAFIEFDEWAVPMRILPQTFTVGGVYPIGGTFTGEYQETEEDQFFTWAGTSSGTASVLDEVVLNTPYGKVVTVRVRVVIDDSFDISLDGEVVESGSSSEVSDWYLARGLGLIRLDRFVQEFIGGALDDEIDFDVTVSLDDEGGLADDDGDGLPNSWENFGVPILGLSERYILPGANPNRKDIYLEIDAMSGQSPTNAVLTKVINAFDDAPVSNPNGAPDGIALHIIGGFGMLDDPSIPPATWSTSGFDNLRTTKCEYFGTVNERGESHALRKLFAKDKAYRYCVFAFARGTSKSSGKAELPGDDMMVTFGLWASPPSVNQVASTLMHELGHTLNLGHGGDQLAVNWKPNYKSIMNYWWQFPRPGLAGWELDYSDIALPALDEGALFEAAGLGAPVGSYLGIKAPYAQSPAKIGLAPLAGTNPVTPVDWDFSTIFDVAPIASEINADPRVGGSAPVAGQVLSGHNDWNALQYNFRGEQGYLELFDESALGAIEPEMTEEDIAFLATLELGGCPGDLNLDGFVDGADLGLLLGAWGTGEPASDLNSDGTVDGADLGLLLGAWGAC
ncbi:MAG: hypothetical protein ACF8GE_03015 [Phycisphaerales bacterium JB043]